MNCSNCHLDAGTNPGVIITVQCFYISKMRGQAQIEGENQRLL
jgi:cytochrome c